MDISGRNILLTGASGGIGQAIARELARLGGRLTITARNEQQLERLSKDLGAAVLVADLRNRSDLDEVAKVAAGCDIVIANAGVGGDRGVEEMTREQIDSSIDVNLRAPVVMATEFSQAHLADGRPGQIVFIGSLAGVTASPKARLYNATKFGLRGFSFALRQDLHGTGIGVSIVEPGFIRDAGMFADSNIELPPGVRTKSPEDVARAVTRAIGSDLAEVYVAPIEMRLATALGAMAPQMGATVQRLLGAADRVK